MYLFMTDTVELFGTLSWTWGTLVSITTGKLSRNPKRSNRKSAKRQEGFPKNCGSSEHFLASQSFVALVLPSQTLSSSRTGSGLLRPVNSCVFENPPDTELWVEALEAKYEGKGKPYGRQEFDALLGHCMVWRSLYHRVNTTFSNLSRRSQILPASISIKNCLRLTLMPRLSLRFATAQNSTIHQSRTLFCPG